MTSPSLHPHIAVKWPTCLIASVFSRTCCGPDWQSNPEGNREDQQSLHGKMMNVWREMDAQTSANSSESIKREERTQMNKTYEY